MACGLGQRPCREDCGDGHCRNDKGAESFPCHGYKGKASLRGADAYALHAALAFRGADRFLLIDFNAGWAYLCAFLAVYAKGLIAGNMDRAETGDYAEKRAIRAEEAAPRIADEDR